MQAYREKLAASALSDLEKQTYETELLAGLNSYTYLAK
jgi:arginine decarboxylase